MARNKKTKKLEILTAILILCASWIAEARYWKSPTESTPSGPTGQAHTCDDLSPWPKPRGDNDQVPTQARMEELDDACTSLKLIIEKGDHSYTTLALTKVDQYCDLTDEEKSKLSDQITKYIKDKNPRPWLKAPLLLTLWRIAKSTNALIEGASLISDKKVRENLLTQALTEPSLTKKETALITENLEDKSPRLKPIWKLKSPGDYLAASFDAIGSGNPDLAIKFLKRMKKTRDFDITRKRLEALRAAQKMKQEKELVIKIDREILNLDYSKYKTQKSDLTAKAVASSAVILARALWTGHRTKAALNTLDRIQKKIKIPFDFSEFDYLRARIKEEAKEIAPAIHLLSKISKELPPEKNPYLWNLAWLYFKSGHFDEAVDVFEKTATSSGLDQGKRSQALYWQGRSLIALGKMEQGQKTLYQIIGEDPHGYYALLSYRELKTKIPTLPDIKLNKPYPPSRFDQKLFNCLVQTEDWKLAANDLSDELPLIEKDSAHWQDILPLYGQAQAYGQAFIKMAGLPNKEKQEMLKNNLAMVFPILYEDIVREESEASGLWPEFVWAIIRQESIFNPVAQSPADALGLMQVLPRVAQSVAKKYGINYQSREDLFNPQINIAIGSRHLKSYLDLFQGAPIFAIAGYNASPDSIKSWLKTRFNSDLTVFIEDIPFEETRNYVKLVLRNMIDYMRRIKSEDSFDFPENLLVLPHDPKKL